MVLLYAATLCMRLLLSGAQIAFQSRMNLAHDFRCFKH